MMSECASCANTIVIGSAAAVSHGVCSHPLTDNKAKPSWTELEAIFQQSPQQDCGVRDDYMLVLYTFTNIDTPPAWLVLVSGLPYTTELGASYSFDSGARLQTESMV
jgi:hypothetical protein